MSIEEFKNKIKKYIELKEVLDIDTEEEIYDKERCEIFKSVRKEVIKETMSIIAALCEANLLAMTIHDPNDKEKFTINYVEGYFEHGSVCLTPGEKME